jgi:hypothetical protein
MSGAPSATSATTVISTRKTDRIRANAAQRSTLSVSGVENI